jgi:hypothetical protein
MSADEGHPPGQFEYALTLEAAGDFGGRPSTSGARRTRVLRPRSAASASAWSAAGASRGTPRGRLRTTKWRRTRGRVRGNATSGVVMSTAAVFLRT